ncbi:hypothetical protein GTCCBUS3UF5_35840 [Geobacillus thermoleovorans CCB_US3_UF5]|uniref:Uncharacterized protein n=1 Tax=Geobacillus thermoleovorans CCB_US3_UF5 TaxID=1111068 RepID=A0ABM5MMQ2_GEOTH|nr:hypothetical protein GTCCBUS3UF5_35840 [Geobacillus thermoleovorans CCB_US3_UF5]
MAHLLFHGKRQRRRAAFCPLLHPSPPKPRKLLLMMEWKTTQQPFHSTNPAKLL